MGFVFSDFGLLEVSLLEILITWMNMDVSESGTPKSSIL